MSDFIANIKAKLDTSGIPSEIKKIESIPIKLGALKLNTNSLTSQIQAALSNHNFTINIKNIKTSGIEASLQKSLNSAGNSISDNLVKKINTQFSNGGIEASIAKITAQYEKLASTGHEKLSSIKSDIEVINGLQSDLSGANGTDAQIVAWEEYTATLSKVKNGLTTVAAESKQTANALQIQTLDNKMSEWLEKNTRAAKEYGDQVQTLRAKLSDLSMSGDVSLGDFTSIKTQFDEINQAAISAGKSGGSFTSTFKNAFASITRYVSTASIIYEAIAAIRQMFQEVLSIDTAMTELNKVSSASSAQLSSVFENSKQSAKEYATVLSDIISATADWSRLGYSLDQSQELAKVSALYKNVGDNISIETANESLISTLQGYHLDASQAESIIDKLNEVANNYAIDSAGIGEALQRSAASFNAANTDLSKSIALITGTNEVVQNPESVGTMWKTVSARIRGAEKELESAGLETDGMVKSTSKLRSYIEDMTGFDIMADEAGTQFKDIYDIVVGIGEVWNDLADVDQAALLEKLAGKRSSNALAAALGNIETIKKVYQTAEFESAGSAQRENEKYLDSMQGRINNLKTAFQGLASSTLDSGFLKGAISGATEFLEIITKIIDTIGLIPTVLSGIGIGSLIKNFDSFSGIKNIEGIIKGLNAGKGLSGVESLFEGLTDTQIASAISASNLSSNLKEVVADVAGVSTEIATSATAAANATSATANLGNAFKGLGVAAISFLTNPVVLATTALAGLATAAYLGSTMFDRAKEKAMDSQTEYLGTTNELTAMNSELDTTTQRIQELQSLKDSGKITLTEESELANLQRQNAELEKNIALLEAQASVQQGDMIKDTNKSFKKEGTKSAVTGQYSDILSTTKQEVEHYKAAKKQLDNLYDDLNSLDEDAPDYEKSKKDLLKRIENQEGTVEEYKKSMIEHSSDISDLMNSYYDANGNLYANLDEEAKRNAKEAKSVLDSVANASKEQSAVEAALSSLDTFFDGSFGKNAIKDEILEMVSSGKTAEEAMRSLGLSMSDLGLENTEEDISTLNRYFEELAESAKSAANAVEEVDGTMSGIEVAMASENAGDDYVKLKDYLDAAKDLFDKGLTGTDDFKTVAEMISQGIDSSAESFSENYERLQRYFTVDGEGALTRTGIDNFVSDLQATGKEFKNTAEAADALNISTEAFETILGRLNDYDIHTFDGLERSAEIFARAKLELGALQDLYDNMEAGDTKDALGAKIEGWEEQLSSLDGDLSSLDTDIILNMKLEYDLATIQAEIDRVQNYIEEKGKGSTDDYAELNSTKRVYRDTSEQAVQWDAEDAVVPIQYQFAGNMISTLQEQLANVTDEDVRLEIQAEISNLYDVQNNILDAFRAAHPEITPETDPSVAQATLDEWIASEEGQKVLLEAEMKSGSSIADLLDSGAITKDVLVNYLFGDQEQPEDADALVDYIMNSQDNPEDSMALLNYIRNYQDNPEAMSALLDYIKRSQSDPDSKKAMMDYIRRAQQSPIPKNTKVNYVKGTQERPSPMTAVVNYVKNLLGFGSATGTAHNFGTAYARGDWGTKSSGIALGGELGEELVVRNGKFFTIGTDSAEFFHYKKGDIIFNAAQTREIFKKGKITSSSPRGRLFAKGTAYSSGTAFADGTADDKLQETDFIEIVLSRMERIVKLIKDEAISAYRALKSRLTASSKEMNEILWSIKVQEQARAKYNEKADSVNLSFDMKQKIMNGDIDISEYDSDTAELIKDFQKWYEASLKCSDAIADLHENLAALYEEEFNTLAKDFENQMSVLEHDKKTYENEIDKLEAKGYLVSKRYYNELISVEQENVKILKKELNDLTYALNTAVKSGEIEVGSKAWYKMKQEIFDVEEAIQEANISLIEYNNTIRKLDWERFDYIQDRISAITNESDFLIDLMESSDLFEDNGKLSDTGMATAGLHGANYNTYMHQADQYAKEIEKIDDEIRETNNELSGNVDSDLIERREELLELQQKAILSANEEKQAIVDLVKDGIEIELESLENLIDTYTESLDRAKDLYDYQKKISSQTSDIASLQKQLSAYENDDSEETRAIIQQLRNDLKEAQDNLDETEYDKYIDEQKKLLDSLYDEYETVLNERLDNVDVLVSEMIDTINANSSDISETLQRESEEVGYSISSSLEDMFNKSANGTNDIISLYGDDFSEKLTSVNVTLNSIYEEINRSGTKTPEIPPRDPGTSGNNDNSQDNTNQPPNNPNSGSSTGSSPDSSADKGSFFIKKKDSYPKSQLNINTSLIDRLKYHDFDSSFDARSKYYNSMGFSGTYTSSTAQNDQMLQWMKTNGFSSGGYIADIQKIAYKNGDDMFTVNTLKRGEAVLTPEQASQFKDLIYSLPQLNHLTDVSTLLSGLNSNLIQGTSVGDISITIPIEHVDNYNDFINQLQKDRQFEKFIQSISVDLLNGGSSLSKNKFKW